MSLCGPACQFSIRTRIVAACTRNVCAAGRAGSPLLAFAGTQETVTKPWKAAAHGRNRHLGNDRVAGTSHLLLFPGMLLPVPERGVADLLIHLQQAAAAAPKILGRIIVFPRHAWFTRKKINLCQPPMRWRTTLHPALRYLKKIMRGYGYPIRGEIIMRGYHEPVL